MKLGLILSNDWELFGNGTGDYFRDQHRPLEELLGVAEQHGARITVMAEVGQQLAHRRIASAHSPASDVAEAWDAILRDVIRRGSDVQLHLHPQWLDAAFSNGSWQLNYDKWAISSLSGVKMESALSEGKCYLEDLLWAVDADYRCVAFRAGAYCLMPSDKVVPALVKVGLLCDTSVTKGLVDIGFYDFREAHSRVLPWFVDGTDVRFSGKDRCGLLEIPICSLQTFDFALLRKFVGQGTLDRMTLKASPTDDDKAWFQIQCQSYIERYPVAGRPFAGARTRPPRTVRWALSKLAGRRTIQLDYDSLTPSMFAAVLLRTFNSNELRTHRSTDIIIPVMASGHVKTIHNCDNFARILGEIKKQFGDTVVFWTLREAVEYWLNLNRDTAVKEEVFDVGAGGS